MYHKPVCVKCQRELIPHRLGVTVLDVAVIGDYKLWSADQYKCPPVV